MFKTKKSLECRPCRMAYIEFDGQSQKGHWPKKKYFVVLDRGFNPSDVDGPYICRVASRTNKSGNPFFVAYPMLKLPDFTEMNTKIIDNIFKDIPYPYRTEYCHKAYDIFVAMLSDFMIPMNVFTFRILQMYIHGDINSDTVPKEIAEKQFLGLCRSYHPNMNQIQLDQICHALGLNKTIQDFLQGLWSLCEVNDWSGVSMVLNKLFTRQDTSNQNFYLIPNQDLEIIHMREYISGGKIAEPKYMGVILYENFEIDVGSIPDIILYRGKNCINYRFEISDKENLTVQLEDTDPITNQDLLDFCYKLLHNQKLILPKDPKEYSVEINRMYREHNHDVSFIGDTRIHVIQ